MTEETRDLKIEIRKGLETIWELDDEETVRNHISAINSLIVRRQMAPMKIQGGPIPLLEPEEIVEKWRKLR